MILRKIEHELSEHLKARRVARDAAITIAALLDPERSNDELALLVVQTLSVEQAITDLQRKVDLVTTAAEGLEVSILVAAKEAREISSADAAFVEARVSQWVDKRNAALARSEGSAR